MDKEHPLRNADWGTSGTTIYRGFLVSYNVPVYDIMGQKVFHPSEVDEVIDKAGTILSESIPDRSSITVKADNGSFEK